MAIDFLVAGWFHQHLSPRIAEILYAMSWPGSAAWIAVVLAASMSCLLWKRHWHGASLLLISVPGGMLAGQIIKCLVHRQRPYISGWFVNWDGYSFPSGHTTGATLLYGFAAIVLCRMAFHWRWKMLAVLSLAVTVLLVGFSRIALGAHYLTDVLGALLLGSVWLALCFSLVAVVRRYCLGCRAVSLVPVESAEPE